VSSISEMSDFASQEDSPKAKRVSFDGAEPARVFEADDWDRSPSEVTLKLTYKDVVELRELDVSLVRTGPLMMERTPSRRPTRQRTPNPSSTSPRDSFYPNPSHGSFPVECHNHRDEPTSRPSSPVCILPNPRLSPLPPLFEDASSSPASCPSSAERRSRDHGAFTPDPYVAPKLAPPSGSPPGLPGRSPRLKALPSPTLAPPSPLSLSSPLFSRSSSPKPSSRPVSPIPLYLHPRSGPVSPRFKKQNTPDSPKPLVFPALTRRASVPDDLTIAAGKAALSPPLSGDNPSLKWKPLGLAGIDANSSSPSLSSGKGSLSSPTATGPVKSWRSGRSLVGWELRRNGGGSGKLGFGLVRKGNTGI